MIEMKLQDYIRYETKAAGRFLNENINKEVIDISYKKETENHITFNVYVVGEKDCIEVRIKKQG
ncbi:hypothetical protein QUF55_08665 [Clostridiaceae bacterium HSG29]|nr:hypothetical protein [Clostridiaceae bacterium HSG29]